MTHNKLSQIKAYLKAYPEASDKALKAAFKLSSNSLKEAKGLIGGSLTTKIDLRSTNGHKGFLGLQSKVGTTPYTREKVIQNYARNLDCKNYDLTGVDLSGLNLRGMSFEGCNLTNTNFNGSNLRTCNFIGSIGLNTKGAFITGAYLKASTTKCLKCSDGMENAWHGTFCNWCMSRV